MAKKEKSSSNYLNSIKEMQDKHEHKSDKINVDRTYVEPQEFQSKDPKKAIKYYLFQDLINLQNILKNQILFLILSIV